MRIPTAGPDAHGAAPGAAWPARPAWPAPRLRLRGAWTAALAVLALCCAHAGAQPTEPAAVQPAVRVATFIAPPLVSGSAVSPAGPFIAYLRLIEAAAPVRFELRVTASAAEAAEALRRGEVDAAGPLPRTARPDPLVRFTAPLVRLPVAIVGRRGAARRGTTLADLDKHRVAVLDGGFIAAALAQEQPGALYDRLPTLADTLTAVAMSEVDYAVLDLAHATWLVPQLGLSGLTVVGQAPFQYEPALAVRHSLPADIAEPLLRAAADLPEAERIRLMQALTGPLASPAPWYGTTAHAAALALAAVSLGAALWAAHRRRLRRQTTLYDAVAGSVDDIVTVRTGDGGRSYVYVSPSLTRLTGFELKDFAGRPIESFFHPDEFDALHAFRARVAGGDAAATLAHRFRKRDGGWVWLETRTKIERRRSGDIDRVVTISHDITERRQIEERIRALAFEDPVTGVPNRAALAQRLHEAIGRAQSRRHSLAVCMLDVDGFKHVNDARGRHVGDSVLKALAETLAGRAPTDRFVARIGADEFVVLIEPIGSDAEAAAAAQRLAELAREPLRVGDESIYLTASIGMALYPHDAGLLDDLLAAAEIALHVARMAGRNTWRRFDGEMGVRRQQQARALHQLRQAYQEGRLMLHYQPKIELQTGRCTGVEALLRVRDGDRVLGPAGLIEAAEESGFITTLGRWVIETAAAQSRAWRATGLHVRIAVNVSTRQLEDPRFAAWMADLASADPALPACLDLEITESALASDARAAGGTLAALQTLGFVLCVDDFGTGYSSLAYLSKMPVQGLKIDCSFVAGLPHGHGAREIVRAVIALAQSMRLTVVAEGVETAEQAEFLRDLDCGQAQGYLFARPLPAEQAAAFALASMPTPRGAMARPAGKVLALSAPSVETEP